MASPEKDFQKDLDAIRADIGALTETLGKFVTIANTAEGKVSQAMRKAAKDSSAAAGDAMDDGAQIGRDGMQAAADGAAAGAASLEEQIKRNPVNSVLIALGVGFLVGIIGQR